MELPILKTIVQVFTTRTRKTAFLLRVMVLVMPVTVKEISTVTKSVMGLMPLLLNWIMVGALFLIPVITTTNVTGILTVITIVMGLMLLSLNKILGEVNLTTPVPTVLRGSGVVKIAVQILNIQNTLAMITKIMIAMVLLIVTILIA